MNLARQTLGVGDPRVEHPPAHLNTMPVPARRSEFADGFRAAQGFGWGAASPPVDIKQLIARKVGRRGVPLALNAP